jgi:hypothetical protein
MNTKNFNEIMYKIIRPVLIYGGVFLTGYILSKFDVHTYLIIFIAVITGIILEKILRNEQRCEYIFKKKLYRYRLLNR